LWTLVETAYRATARAVNLTQIPTSRKGQKGCRRTGKVLQGGAKGRQRNRQGARRGNLPKVLRWAIALCSCFDQLPSVEIPSRPLPKSYRTPITHRVRWGVSSHRELPTLSCSPYGDRPDLPTLLNSRPLRLDEWIGISTRFEDTSNDVLGR
jgi:hypothetical protein